jgi:hypothetical protein
MRRKRCRVAFSNIITNDKGTFLFEGTQRFIENLRTVTPYEEKRLSASI